MGWVWFFLLCFISLLGGMGIIRYRFFIDNLSLGLCLLSFFIGALIWLTLIGDYKLNYNLSIGLTVFILLNLIFIFSTLNLILFYFSFEFIVVPIFLLILLVGSRIERLQSSLFLFLYTLVSSIPFFIFVLIGFYVGRSLRFFRRGEFLLEFSFWWGFITLVFLVKLPVFIIHLWLPKAHVEAPLIGSMILAGVLLKLGGYGLYKIYGLIEELFYSTGWLYLTIGLYGGLIIAMVCLSQVDIKSLIAYSSIVHMGPVLSGVVSIIWFGWLRSFLIILSHGICSSGIFFILNLFYERLGSRSVLVLKGLNLLIPVVIFMYFLIISSNISVPPTFNFYSELILILGLLKIGLLIKAILGIMFLIVGVYNVFFYVSLNHRDKKFIHTGLDISTEKELRVLRYHNIPLYLFPFYFFLFCFVSL